MYFNENIGFKGSIQLVELNDKNRPIYAPLNAIFWYCKAQKIQVKTGIEWFKKSYKNQRYYKFVLKYKNYSIKTMIYSNKLK